MKIYVASSWSNIYFDNFIKELKENCKENCKDDYIYNFKDCNFHWYNIDNNYEKWIFDEFYRIGLFNKQAVDIFNHHLSFLNKCDLCILLLPSGLSAHMEAAYTKGKDIPVVVYLPEEEKVIKPELMYRFFNLITSNKQVLFNYIEERRNKLDKLNNFWKSYWNIKV